MKIEIENLKAQMQGRELNIYQKADALIEFNKLLDYVEELEQLTIPVVVPRTFTLTWKDAQKEPPKEGGRYWCVVRDINDLGTSYYQWNCAYSPENTWEGKWSSNALRKDVVLWTELPQMPV